MPIAIMPALIPDIPRIYEIYFDSFRADAMGRVLVDILFPGGKTGTPEFREGHAKATLDWWHKNDFQYTMKAIDSDTGEIIGMGMGDYYVKERTEEERKFHGCVWLEGKERERADEVVRPLAEMREKLFGGRKYIYLHFMVVDKKNQGRGAGRAFVQWAIDLGEALALPVYFESSPSTVKLYEKMGFERLKEVVTHKGKLLGMTVLSVDVPLMVRMPSVAGMTFDEWRAAGYPKYGKEKGAAAAAAVETKKPVVTTGVADVGGKRKSWWRKLVR